MSESELSTPPFRVQKRTQRVEIEKGNEKLWAQLGSQKVDFPQLPEALRMLRPAETNSRPMTLDQVRALVEYPNEKVPITLCVTFKDVLEGWKLETYLSCSLETLVGYMLKRRIQHTHQAENIAWSPLMDAYDIGGVDQITLDDHPLPQKQSDDLADLAQNMLWKLGAWLPEAPTHQVEELLNFQSKQLWQVVGRKARLVPRVWNKLGIPNMVEQGRDEQHQQQEDYAWRVGELLGEIAQNPTLTGQQIQQIYETGGRWLGVHLRLISHPQTPQYIRLRLLEEIGKDWAHVETWTIEAILAMNPVGDNPNCWKRLAAGLTDWRSLLTMLEHPDRKSTPKILSQICQHCPDQLVGWLEENNKTASLSPRDWSQILGQLSPKLRQRALRVSGNYTKPNNPTHQQP